MKYILISLLFACQQSFSQPLTSKDFKISLDGFALSDSSNIIRIPKEQLITIISKKLHTNFIWGHIKSFIIYIGNSDVMSASCNGDTICPDLKKYFERAQEGTVFAIDPTVVNNQGKEVPWNGLIILVK